jgi:hypothetical protein
LTCAASPPASVGCPDGSACDLVVAQLCLMRPGSSLQPQRQEPTMTQSLAPARTRTPSVVDPRGPRFAAGLTTVVLAVVLVLHATELGVVLLALQAGVFALGASRGPQATPYAAWFRRFVRPRLAPPAELEDVRPLRFAQAVGLGFAVIGVIGLLVLPAVGMVAVAAAFAAAFLNVAFGYCLGCEAYLLLRRALPAGQPGTL